MLPIFPIRTACRLFLLTLAVAFVSATSAAQATGNCTTHDASTRPDCAQAIAFFDQLQPAVKAADKNKLASMVNYPLRANFPGKRLQIRTRSQFLKDYARLFTPQVVCAIESAKDSDVWGNYQGFMIGKGVIWWEQIVPASAKTSNLDSGNYPFKIIAINVQDVSVPGCKD